MDASAPTTSLEVRERLVEALKLALVGPGAGHALAEERLHRRERPSNWYLTAFLIPSGTPPEQSADAGKARRALPHDLPEVRARLVLSQKPWTGLSLRPVCYAKGKRRT